MTNKVFIYSLSTCPWCKKTKELLDKMGVKYTFTDVDLLPSKERNELIEKEKLIAFPRILINDKRVVGFQEKKIIEALLKDSEK